MHEPIPQGLVLFGLAAALAVAAAAALVEWIRRSVVASPNEWLLVIDNGKMVKAGIGMHALRGWNQQIVRFPSFIQKVSFSARQVPRETPGLEVGGLGNRGQATLETGDRPRLSIRARGKRAIGFQKKVLASSTTGPCKA